MNADTAQLMTETPILPTPITTTLPTTPMPAPSTTPVAPVKEKPKSEFQLQAYEVVLMFLAFGLIGTMLVRFAMIPEMWHWSTLLLILAGLVCADFVSGMVHWAGDTWGTEATPVLGKKFVKPFRFHHAHPLNMLHTNFFTTNADTALGASPFMIAPFFMPLDTPLWRTIAFLSLCTGAWGMWSSQFHLWAHMKNPPRLVRLLQKSRFILTREHHWKHHKSPFVKHYCITTGWCDLVLERIRWFQGLEWVITRVTPLKVREASESDSHIHAEEVIG